MTDTSTNEQLTAPPAHDAAPDAAEEAVAPAGPGDRASVPQRSDADQPAASLETESDRAAEAAVADGSAPADEGDAVTDASATAEPTTGTDSDDDADEDGGDPLDVEGEIAADYLEELLDIADLDGDIDTYVESGRAHVSIVTESDVLVGPEGKVLDALQELARLAVVTETGHRSRLMLDVAGHRDQRRTELAALATEAIDEARTSGEQVRLAPMNAFERKIVHDAVAAAGLTSESEGEEPQRRVVVIPR